MALRLSPLIDAIAVTRSGAQHETLQPKAAAKAKTGYPERGNQAPSMATNAGYNVAMKTGM